MIELIKSRGFLEHLISFDHVLPSIMIPKVKKDGAVDFSSRSYNSVERLGERELNQQHSKPMKFI